MPKAVLPKPAVKEDDVIEARTWTGTCRACDLFMEAEEWTLRQGGYNEGRAFNVIRCARCGFVTELRPGKLAVEALWE